VQAWPIGTVTNSTFPHMACNDATKGAYLAVFSYSFEGHPKFLQKPTLMRMKLHLFRPKAHGSGSAVSGIPLA